MTPFSASDAALEGFRVVREHWRLVVGWAIFNLMAMIAMVCATVVVLLVIGFALTASGDGEGTAKMIGGVVSALFGGFGTFAIEVVVVAGLFRALLRPEEPGFLHLRLGADEIRLLLVWLVMLIAGVLLVTFGLVVVRVLTASYGLGAGVAAGALIFALLVWLALRFSLAAPMTFADRKLRIGESWGLTRGRVVPLLGMSVITFCLLAIVFIVGWLLLFVLIGSVSGFRELGLISLSDPQHLVERPGAFLLQLSGQLLFAPVMWVITQAPLLAAYKAFRDPA